MEFQNFILVILKCQPMLASYTFTFIFVEVIFIKISENKNPLKITCYTVPQHIQSGAIMNHDTVPSG